jgi:hypothetical protein
VHSGFGFLAHDESCCPNVPRQLKLLDSYTEAPMVANEASDTSILESREDKLVGVHDGDAI